MIRGLLGKKLGMTQVFSDTGEAVPVTVIEAGPCVITQVKTKATDGYDAVQLGFGLAKRLTKPERGHLGKLPALRYLRELRVDQAEGYQLGGKVDVSVFKPGELVDVTGLSKGKGFAGVVKRHHFAGGPRTHGQSDRHRAPGAISSGTTPGRVLKGKRMAGHMGAERVTVQNLQVVQADLERNLLLVKGTVPGGTNGLVLIKAAVKSTGGR
ncbi:MAG: 50S ribosomal protein L3 [Chloroflexi bacterium]|nr:50S ribosomal protein L3 [Chloroflexota bacterium]MBI5956514.1 50S ribosomal protein L3 [Chloroflexota bacterium]